MKNKMKNGTKPITMRKHVTMNNNENETTMQNYVNAESDANE